MSIIGNKHFFQLLALETTMSSSNRLFLKGNFYTLEVHWPLDHDRSKAIKKSSLGKGHSFVRKTFFNPITTRFSLDSKHKGWGCVKSILPLCNFLSKKKIVTKFGRHIVYPLTNILVLKYMT